MINKTTLIGNLGQAPEFQTLESGVVVCRLSLATNKNFKDKTGEWKTKTEWHSIILWREAAERAAKTLIKGDLVYVEGEINYRAVETDGIKRNYTDIVCRTFRRMTKRDQVNENIPTEEPQAMVTQNTPSPAPPTEPPKSEDDDLPF